MGTLELSNPPRWRWKKRANAPSSVTLYSRIVPFKHFNVRFFVSIKVFLFNSARILIKTARHDDTSLWFGLSIQNSAKVRETFRQITQKLWARKTWDLDRLFSYTLVFYNISFSWLLPLDGFQFIFFVAWQRKRSIQLHFRWRKDCGQCMNRSLSSGNQ